ncbi:MAG: cation transporter [Acidobacteria bacterium]|nr:cation transporter [Acidobacteriota bacterium]
MGDEEMRRKNGGALFGVLVILALGAVSASAATKTATIHVEGMHCKMCADSIAKALKATAGVEKVEVSFEKGVAVVRYDDQKVTEAKLREVINGTGYKAVENKAADNKAGDSKPRGD